MRKKNNPVTRRGALRRLLVGFGAAATPAWVRSLSDRALAVSGLPEVSGQDEDWQPRALDDHQNRTVDLISELIIPETETPGARGARVNRFIDTVLAESDPADRTKFLQGLEWMDVRSRRLFGSTFLEASPQQQRALLTIVSSAANRSLDDQIGKEFFLAIKSLTVTGYYTSEIGIFEELEEGEMFFEDYPGCTHPEHQSTQPSDN